MTKITGSQWERAILSYEEEMEGPREPPHAGEEPAARAAGPKISSTIISSSSSTGSNINDKATIKKVRCHGETEIGSVRDTRVVTVVQEGTSPPPVRLGAMPAPEEGQGNA